MRVLICVLALADLGSIAGSAVAGEPPGRVTPDGKTSRGGDFGVSISVSQPYAKLHATKALGTAKVTVDVTFQWGPETTTSIRRVTGKGTIVVKTASCTSETLTFSVREH